MFEQGLGGEGRDEVGTVRALRYLLRCTQAIVKVPSKQVQVLRSSCIRCRHDLEIAQETLAPLHRIHRYKCARATQCAVQSARHFLTRNAMRKIWAPPPKIQRRAALSIITKIQGRAALSIITNIRDICFLVTYQHTEHGGRGTKRQRGTGPTSGS